MADRTESRIVVDATPSGVLDVIADFEAYPDWAGAVKQAEVEKEYDDGWPQQVRFVLDAGVIKDTYSLAYEWDVDEDGTGTVTWSLVQAEQLLRGLDGSYALRAVEGGTEVIYQLAVDLRIPMLGLLKRKAEKGIIETALGELKKRAEG
ncbi:MAG TPA: SRPBCC family protein [Actinomycetales bacterium]|nr:SRPBCC family protein [Actinomycetales bacterium]